MREFEFGRSPISVAPMVSSVSPDALHRPQQKLHHPRVPVMARALLALMLCSACDRKETSDNTATVSESDKQERLAALLKENGVDPSTLPGAASAASSATSPIPASAPSNPTSPATPALSVGSAGAAAPSNSPPASAATPPAEANQTAPASTPTSAPPIKVVVLNPGSSPKAALRYRFVQGDTHKFTLDIQVSAERKVNGQPSPGMPPFSLTLRGSTTTLQADPLGARRQHTFVEMIPTVAGAPPELATQIKAQYASLGGLQLIETVSTRGMIQGMELDSRAIHPQVLALMQHLQDGMTNSFLALPEEPIGPGARWVATTATDAAGIAITQTNEITLTSLQGDTAEVTLQLKQSAKPSKISGANLPPGVSIELEKLDGAGKGTMRVNFKEVIISSKVELSTQMETAVTQPDVTGITKEAATTSVKAQISITK